MNRKVSAWQAKDGTLFLTEAELIEYEEIDRRANDIASWVSKCLSEWGVSDRRAIQTTLLDNWDSLKKIILKY